jgi:hypothetical protein
VTEELCKGGRVRKLAPSDGWQTAPTAVARRVVEDEQEDAAEDEAVLEGEPSVTRRRTPQVQ